MSVEWSHFDKYEDIIDQYMPPRGEGDTLASQAVTAVNKLIYKWYNDGDVYDNVHSRLEGWANDLSSYANWLRAHTPAPVPMILDSIRECRRDDDYEDLLANLASAVLNPRVLDKLAQMPSEGSIYEANGPFKFREYNEYYDEDEEYGEYYDQEYDDDFDDYDRDYEGDVDDEY